jgi:hypothetical protein
MHASAVPTRPLTTRTRSAQPTVETPLPGKGGCGEMSSVANHLRPNTSAPRLVTDRGTSAASARAAALVGSTPLPTRSSRTASRVGSSTSGAFQRRVVPLGRLAVCALPPARSRPGLAYSRSERVSGYTRRSWLGRAPSAPDPSPLTPAPPGRSRRPGMLGPRTWCSSAAGVSSALAETTASRRKGKHGPRRSGRHGRRPDHGRRR